jgi:hypothetical protein
MLWPYATPPPPAPRPAGGAAAFSPQSMVLTSTSTTRPGPSGSPASPSDGSLPLQRSDCMSERRRGRRLLHHPSACGSRSSPALGFPRRTSGDLPSAGTTRCLRPCRQVEARQSGTRGLGNDCPARASVANGASLSCGRWSRLGRCRRGCETAAAMAGPSGRCAERGGPFHP